MRHAERSHADGRAQSEVDIEGMHLAAGRAVVGGRVHVDIGGLMDWLSHLSDMQLFVLAMVCWVGLIATAIALIDPEI